MAKAKPPDPKLEALRQQGSLNPRPDKVRDPLFTTADFFDARDLIQVKYEMVRRVLVDGQPVSSTASSFGFSRPTFYQAQAALESGGLAGLVLINVNYQCRRTTTTSAGPRQGEWLPRRPRSS
jgi:hypothetical protein